MDILAGVAVYKFHISLQQKIELIAFVEYIAVDVDLSHGVFDAGMSAFKKFTKWLGHMRLSPCTWQIKLRIVYRITAEIAIFFLVLICIRVFHAKHLRRLTEVFLRYVYGNFTPAGTDIPEYTHAVHRS